MYIDSICSYHSPYREDFTVSGYRFGKGDKAACILGPIRGNEIQQLYICSQLVRITSYNVCYTKLLRCREYAKINIDIVALNSIKREVMKNYERDN